MAQIWVEVENSRGEVKVVGDNELLVVRVFGKVEDVDVHLHTTRLVVGREGVPEITNQEECEMETVQTGKIEEEDGEDNK
mgnify:CR=1 FL=1